MEAGVGLRRAGAGQPSCSEGLQEEACSQCSARTDRRALDLSGETSLAEGGNRGRGALRERSLQGNGVRGRFSSPTAWPQGSAVRVHCRGGAEPGREAEF